MNTILLVITICAVAVAVAAGVALVLAYRQEKSRSEARVMALQQMAADGSEPIAPAPIVFDDLDTYDDATAARPMFTGEREPAPWGRRFVAAAAMASVVAIAGYVLLPRNGEAPTRSSGPTAPAPLELLSLRHTPETGRLVITGLVQNPRGGAPLMRIVATAFLFGADGTFLASGRAPLDFSTLAAGDESPFVVAVPVTSPVARYRIGFRSEDGQVIAHVDRRAASTLARTGE
jgi:hypothetical protein